MASKIHLTLACGDYDLTHPLREETVKPESIELTVVNLTSPERQIRAVSEGRVPAPQARAAPLPRRTR